jgi:predicted nucleic acid-binding protein
VSAVIVDTGAILALLDEAYDEHPRLAEIVNESTDPLVVSPLVAAEADYMLLSRLGGDAARRFAGDIAAGAYELAGWSAADHAAAISVMDRYGNSKDYTGVTDAANVVLADTYRTTRIMTLDQRHFRVLRPLWGADHFTILPYDD